MGRRQDRHGTVPHRQSGGLVPDILGREREGGVGPAECPVQVDGGAVLPGEGVLALRSEEGAPEGAVALGAGKAQGNDGRLGGVHLLRRHDQVEVVVLAPREAAMEGKRQCRTLEGDERNGGIGEASRQAVQLARQGQRASQMLLAKLLKSGLFGLGDHLPGDLAQAIEKGRTHAVGGGKGRKQAKVRALKKQLPEAGQVRAWTHRLTEQLEFRRHLTTGEIADAVRRLRKRSRGTAHSRRRGPCSGSCGRRDCPWHQRSSS